MPIGRRAGAAREMTDEQPPPSSTPPRWIGPERWRQVELSLAISAGAVRRARRLLVVFAPLFAAIIVVYDHRRAWLRPWLGSGSDVPIKIATIIALLILGWALARNIGRALAPALFERLDPPTAGTVGFVIRLLTVLIAAIIAVRIAGVPNVTLGIATSVIAIVAGLAAQQTLGNLFAGVVLLSARPFRVGDRVRLQGGALAGQIEGVVSSLGLLYTTFADGENAVLVPNGVVLGVSVTPLREPDAVSLRARLRPGTTPLDLQKRIADALDVEIRGHVTVTLEELDGSEVIVRISATPMRPGDGGLLASELLGVVSRETVEQSPASDEQTLAQSVATAQSAAQSPTPAAETLAQPPAAAALPQPPVDGQSER